MKIFLIKYKEFIVLCFISLFLFFLTISIPPKYSFGSDSLSQYVHSSQVNFHPFPKIGFHCNWMKPLGDCELTSFNLIFKNQEYLSPFSYSIIFIKSIIGKILPATSFLYIGLILYLLTFWLLFLYKTKNRFLISVILLCSALFFHSIGFLDVAISNFCFFLAMWKKEKDIESITYLSLASWFRIETVIFTGLYVLLKQNSIKERIRNLFIVGLVFSIYCVGNLHFYGSIFGERVSSNLGGILNIFTVDRLKIISSLLFFGNSRIGFFLYHIFLLPFLAYILLGRGTKNQKRIVWILFFAMFVTVIFSPNDSNIDWGTRYLSHFAIVSVFIISEVDLNRFWKNQFIKYFTIILFLFSIFLSYNYYKIYRVSAKQIKKFQEVFHFVDSKNLLFTNRFLANHSGLDVLSRRYILIPKDELDWKILQSSLLKNEKELTFVHLDFSDTSLGEQNNVISEENQNVTNVLNFLNQNYVKKQETFRYNIRAIHFSKK